MEKRIKLDEIKFTRYRDSLPENLVIRIKRLYPILTEIFPWSLDETVDNFCYDAHPEREVEIWEKLVKKFEFRCKISGAKAKEEKREIFREIFKESGAGEFGISKDVPSA